MVGRASSDGGDVIELVCFDLGGVVVRIRRTFRDCCAAAGVPYEEVARDAAAEAALERAYMRGELSAEAYAARASSLCGGVYAPATLLAVSDAVIEGAYAGVDDLIDRIHAAGRRTAVLSNTCAPHWRVVRDWPVLQKIQQPFASHLIGEVKPDAAAYRVVERGTGVAPERILFFDDNAANVDAARACGWNATLIDPSTSTSPQVAAALQLCGIL